MASILWLSLCLVMFVQNLMDLLNDRHQLSYKIVEQNDVLFDKDHDLNYLVCTSFEQIRKVNLNNPLTSDPATQKVSVKSFLNHSIASIERRLKVTRLFRLNESFIFNGHLCFLAAKSTLVRGQEGEKPFYRFLAAYVIQSFFIYSKEKQPNFYERAYVKNDYLGSIYLRAYKQKVLGTNHLLNADCSNRAHQIHHDRFSCLNRCFVKLKMRSGFYRFNDSGTFDLSDIFEENQIMKREENEGEEPLGVLEMLPTLSAIEGAEDCLRKCPERACFWEVVNALKIDYSYYTHYLRREGKGQVDLQVNTYAAFYSMNDFHLQLFGLLALFTGTSALRLLQALLSLMARKIEPLLKNEKLLQIFRLAIPNLKNVPILLCFVLVLIQGLAMVNEFRFHSSYPNRTSTLNFSSEPFSIVMCLPILAYEEDGRNSSILNESVESIEKHSKDLNHSIEDMEIYSSEGIKPEFKFSDEVFFKILEINGQRRLSRCFRLDFDLDERHRNMPLTYLKIKFKTEEREVFLIERHQNFTSGLENFRGLFHHQKVTKKYSKSSKKFNCRDYSNEPNCSSRKNCLDRCLSTRFIEKHGSIPTNTVVSFSHLNSTWLKGSVYFNETVDEEIQRECSVFFNQTDCNEVRFEESPDKVNSEIISGIIRIRLSYLNIVEREMEYDPLKTLLDIIGLETVLFGSNALGVLTTVLLFLCRILRLKWRWTYRVSLLLLASAGFLVHNVLVFQAIISGDLDENEFFEKPEQYSLPSPILCFWVGKGVDENHRVTGEYLDHLTDHLTFQRVFRSIRYNNLTHYKELHISRLNSTKSSTFYSSTELELSHFYYRGLKCLKTHLKVSYKEEDFFLLEDKIVLRIYLNLTFANEVHDLPPPTS